MEDRRYKAINYLFEPTYIKGANSVYGMCGEYYPIDKLNYFDYQYYLHEGEDDAIKSYKKEEDLCRQFLKEEIGFTELIVSIENFYTLQTILLNLESEYQRRFIYGNKMSEVAKLLGAELNSDFNLKDSSFTYRLTERGLYSRYKNNLKWYPSGMLEDLLIGNYQIICKPRSILDPAEKRYLSQIIRPFKDQVIAIAKRSANYGEFIDIMIDEGDIGDCGNIYLPYFKPDSMYKGMKVNREYTLEQLGL